MLALYLTLLVVPACAIFLWERFVVSKVPHAWSLYAATGIIGSPVHELAHVVGCVLFRLPIRKVVLYRPDRATGLMGYVVFAYRPGSWLNHVGMAVQGIAPMMAGAVIAVLALSLVPYAPEDQSLTSMSAWLWTAASTPFPALLALAGKGPVGGVMAVFVVCVSLHAIPSIADMKVGWNGVVALLLFFLFIAGLSILVFGLDFGAVTHLNVVRELLLVLEYWLWCLAFGVIGIVAIAVSASFFVLLLPNFILSRLCRPSPSQG